MSEPTTATPEVGYRGSVGRDHLSRQDWVDAAYQTVIDDPTVSITIDSLSERLGVTKGSFYHHFKDRTALIIELQKVRDKLVLDIAADADAVADPAERFRQYCIDVFTSRGYLQMEVVMERERVRYTEVDKALRSVDDEAYEWQLQALKDLGFSPDEAPRHLRILKAASMGLVLLMMHEGVSLPLEERVEFANTIVDMAVASAADC